MRLVHISDLHYNGGNAGRIARLLETVSAARPDHLVISGDLAATAQTEELVALREILDRHGFSSGDRLTVVPGNHDLFRFIYRTFESPHAVLGNPRTLLGMATTARTLWRFRRQVLDYNLETYHQELVRFRADFPNTFEGHVTAEESVHGFPFARLLPDNVALIGVNSNHYLPKLVSLFNVLRFAPYVIRTRNISRIGQNLSGSTGYVHIEPLQKLLEHPDVQGRRKILTMHHYLYDDHVVSNDMLAHTMHEMRLVNRQQVLELVRSSNIEVVLHGHWHVMDKYRMGRATILNGGGALWSGFNLVEISSVRTRVTVGANSYPVSLRSRRP